MAFFVALLSGLIKLSRPQNWFPARQNRVNPLVLPWAVHLAAVSLGLGSLPVASPKQQHPATSPRGTAPAPGPVYTQ